MIDDEWTDSEKLSALGHFDVMTENSYPARSSWEQVIETMVHSPAAKLVMEDELRFEARTEKRILIVEEVPTLIYGDEAYEPAAIANERAGFKLVRYVRAADGVAPDTFRARYEAVRVPEIAAIFEHSIGIRRNYLRFDDPMSFTGAQEAPRAVTKDHLPCDMVEEIWFESREAAAPDVVRFDQQRAEGRGSSVESAASPLVVMDERRMPRPGELHWS